jgi:transcriptional regulator with XRE-family HTH domain
MGDTELPATITTFGEAVRYLREKRGLTLRALAGKVGVSPPFLSDLEHNRRSTDKQDELARALGVAPDVLKKLDNRFSDLKEWLSANPELATLLRDIRSSGKSAEEIRTTVFGRRRR